MAGCILYSAAVQLLFWISHEKYYPVLATVTMSVNVRLSHITEQGVKNILSSHELSKYYNLVNSQLRLLHF